MKDGVAQLERDGWRKGADGLWRNDRFGGSYKMGNALKRLGSSHGEETMQMQGLQNILEQGGTLHGIDNGVRITRDALFMQMAELVALRGTCPRAQVGAVLVKDKRIISMGYNGAPPGQPHCTEVGCEEHGFLTPDSWCDANQAIYMSPEARSAAYSYLKYVEEQAGPYMEGCTRTIHAEANSILWAGRAGISTVGTQMYSTYSPCAHCAKMIVAAGVTDFLYKNDYRAADLQLLEDMGVKVMKVV